jgi:hypothetical protein
MVENFPIELFLQDAVKTYLSSLAASFFAEGIEKLVS